MKEAGSTRNAYDLYSVVPVSNLTRYTNHSAWDFLRFSSVPNGEFRDSILNYNKTSLYK
jgi:hypothetical protein